MRNQKLAGLVVYKNADVLLYRHLLAEVEVEVRDKNGRTQYEFKQIDRENHWFDCLNYSLAIGHFMQKTKVGSRLDRPTDNKRRPLSETHRPEEM